MQNHFLYILLVGFVGISCSQSSTEISEFQQFLNGKDLEFDLLISNGLIINGLDDAIAEGDVLIKGEKIVFVGDVESQLIQVNEEIDASGQVVCPGFIDAHAHGNPLETPEFENFLRMGVTTISLGQDGTSPKESNLRTWMEEVDQIQPGVNIALFVGHGTLRLLSGANYQENLDPSLIRKMSDLLEAAFEAGCYGLSMGLEYTPGIYADEDELMAMARVVGAHQGIIMSHIRNEDDDQLEASIRELLALGDTCRVHVAHLKSVYGKGVNRAEQILSLLKEHPGATADIYPYNASYTGIGIVFPKWAKAPNDYNRVKKQRRSELLTFLKNKIEQRNGPEATLFGTGYFAGRTLKELSDEAGRPYEEILLDIGPNGASGAYRVMDEDLQERFFQDDLVMISSDGSPTMRHPRGYGSFAKIIETYVLDKKLLSLPKAIHKMSGLTAKTIGLQDRGTIVVGQQADLLIFEPEKVKAQATFVKPKQLASGFDWVIVNGRIAIREGALKRQRFGKLLKKKK